MFPNLHEEANYTNNSIKNQAKKKKTQVKSTLKELQSQGTKGEGQNKESHCQTRYNLTPSDLYFVFFEKGLLMFIRVFRLSVFNNNFNYPPKKEANPIHLT